MGNVFRKIAWRRLSWRRPDPYHSLKIAEKESRDYDAEYKEYRRRQIKEKDLIRPMVVLPYDGPCLWGMLPSDVKGTIFHYFSLATCATVLATVCKQWKDDVWLGIRSMNLQPYYLVLTNEQLKNILSHCGYLRTLKLDFCDRIKDEGIQCIAEFQVSIYSLSLDSCGITDLGLEAICKRMVRLGELSISHSQSGITDRGISCISNLTNLKKLDLSALRLLPFKTDHKNLQENVFPDLFGTLVNLEQLYLYQFWVEDLRLIWNNLHRLRVLDLRYNRSIKPEEMIGKMDSLECFSGECSNAMELAKLPKLNFLRLLNELRIREAEFNLNRSVWCDIQFQTWDGTWSWKSRAELEQEAKDKEAATKIAAKKETEKK
jgi:hypothetical protein